MHGEEISAAVRFGERNGGGPDEADRDLTVVRIIFTSSELGAQTLKIMSAVEHTLAASGITAAPAARYASWRHQGRRDALPPGEGFPWNAD